MTPLEQLSAPVPADAVDPRLRVISGITLPEGFVNTDDETLRAHIAASLRRQHPQIKRMPSQRDRICLLGGGPSLEPTLPELRDLIYEGAKVVTTNGAYHWALEHNLEPKTQIIMDARASNVRFLDPPLPRCHYVLSSTCHPDLWDRVEGRPHVWVWHPVAKTDPAAAMLDAYYSKAWEWIAGGTTVITRALFVLRLLGFLRFDLFGVDSCWLYGANHAYPQPENGEDKQYRLTAAPEGHPTLTREFLCAGWHLKQLEDFLRILRFAGDQFLLNVHGDGLLAHVLQANATVVDLEQLTGTQADHNGCPDPRTKE